MAQLTPAAADTASQVVTGSFTGATAGVSVPVGGRFNIVLSGTFSATIIAEYSFDGGTTWVAALTLDGIAASFTIPGAVLGDQPEANTLLRLRCTAFVSGPVGWRISR